MRRILLQTNPKRRFNPRARVGRDHVNPSNPQLWTRFNPRARVGRDADLRRQAQEAVVSIHAPAWGATTLTAHVGRTCHCVSIHAPAWGATQQVLGWYASLRRFQSTRPRGARPPIGCSWCLRRQFQSTRPRGARHLFFGACARLMRVSIHAPAWGATLSICV